VAGHPHPRTSSPTEPLAGPLRPLAPREPPAGSLRPLAPQETPARMPHLSKPQERSPVGVGRLKCPSNINNDKIYQIKQ
jgi:hypothetical protein